MSFSLRAAAIALGSTLVAGVAHAQQAPVKIAYVNTQALMAAAPGAAAAEALLNKEGQVLQGQLQKMQDSANALLLKYQKDEPTLTAALKDSRQKAIQTYENEVQAKNQQFQQQFDARKNEVMAPITDAVKRALDDIRAEDGYAVIFANDPQTSVIVSADKNLDITDRVASRLRTMKAVAAPAAAAPKPGAPTSPAGVTAKPPKPPTQ